MSLPRHGGATLRRFLIAIDDALDRSVELVIIGGSALALGYEIDAATTDIDTYESRVDRLDAALAQARAATGLAIPLQNSTIAQLPEGYERRVRRVLPDLRHLRLWVLEPHDLAASKLLRGTDHDRQQLAAYHAQHGLDRETLLARFRDLLHDYVGDPREPRWSLYHFVGEIWGELAALDLRP